jgi:hypothetical protein
VANVLLCPARGRSDTNRTRVGSVLANLTRAVRRNATGKSSRRSLSTNKFETSPRRREELADCARDAERGGSRSREAPGEGVIWEAGGSDTRGGGARRAGPRRGTRALAENVDAATKSARAVSFSAERATLARSLFGGRRARGTRFAASRRRRGEWGETYPRLWSPASVRFRVRRACFSARAARVAARSSPRSRARKRGGDGLAEFEFESFRFAWRALLAARWKARSLLRAARGILKSPPFNLFVFGYFHAWKKKSSVKISNRSYDFAFSAERTGGRC